MTQAADTAAQRVLRIFESFSTFQTPLSLTQLAEATAMPKSTCHAIVNTLVGEGYLYTLRSPRSMYPTTRFWEIGQRINAADPIVLRLLPMMERLRDQTRETVLLAKRQGDSVLNLQVVESRHPIRYMANAGDVKPLHSSATGKALLATLSDEELRKVLKAITLKRYTPKTITTATALRRDLEESRRRGYAIADEETVADVSAIAVTLNLGVELFAIAVVGPTHRIRQAMPAILKSLMRVQTEASSV